MAITDELREQVRRNWDHECGMTRELLAIADRIDAEHEKAVRDGYNDGYDAGFASADDWYADHADELEEHGWVALPRDADGVPIRVGDEMAWETGERIRVASMEYNGHGWLMRDYMGDPHHLYNARHYHAPTVEDVLREFALACEDEGNAGPAVMRLAAEYAKRLRLAEGVE